MLVSIAWIYALLLLFIMATASLNQVFILPLPLFFGLFTRVSYVFPYFSGFPLRKLVLGSGPHDGVP